MVKSFKIRPPNSLFIVADPSAEAAPAGFDDAPIAFNGSCLANGCLNAADGETGITFGRLGELDQVAPARFEDIVPTPTRKLALYTVQWESFAEQPVKNARTHLKAWLNDDRESDEILIEYD